MGVGEKTGERNKLKEQSQGASRKKESGKFWGMLKNGVGGFGRVMEIERRIKEVVQQKGVGRENEPEEIPGLGKI